MEIESNNARNLVRAQTTATVYAGGVRLPKLPLGLRKLNLASVLSGTANRLPRTFFVRLRFDYYAS